MATSNSRDESQTINTEQKEKSDTKEYIHYRSLHIRLKNSKKLNSIECRAAYLGDITIKKNKEVIAKSQDRGYP